jgi:hypothetical protein
MILAFLQLLDGELSSALTSISSIPELVTALKRFAPAAAGVLTGTVVMVFVGFAPMEHLTITVRVVSVLVQAILSGISSWICANSSWRVSVLRGIASGGVGAGILELTYLVSTTLAAWADQGSKSRGGKNILTRKKSHAKNEHVQRQIGITEPR